MDDKTSLLKDEYLLLLRFYEDFDARLITIKGWSSTVAIAAIGFGFQNARPQLWLYAAGASIVFWLLEGTWKSFQYAYAHRIQAIEGAFRDHALDAVTPCQTYASWYEGWRRRNVWRVLRLPIVAFPHLVTAVAGVLLFAFRDWVLPP